MMRPDPVADAVSELEAEVTYQDIGVASIHDTVECLILAKPAVDVLRKEPRRSTEVLLARFRRLPGRSSELPRIGMMVALGDLGRKEALPTLAAYLADLPDAARDRAGRIDHPFRYALRAIERITGAPWGLGPGEDLGALFTRRHEIARHLISGPSAERTGDGSP
jgi:hypothetical protein